MARKFFFGILIFVLLTTPVVPQHAAKAEPVAEFFAAPSAVMAGGEVVFSGYGFTPNDVVELYLQTTLSEYLGTLPTDDLGNFAGALPIPAVDPGDYDVMA